MGLFPTGVALITCGGGVDTEVITANAVTSISLEPPLVLVAVTEDGRIRHGIERRGTFAVNFLAEDQAGLAALFSTRTRPRGVEAAEVLGSLAGKAGDALVRSAVAGLECTVAGQYAGGDHVMFLGRARTPHLGEGTTRRPLLFHRGRFTGVAVGDPCRDG